MQISYEMPNSQKNVELPFVMGVMSDLSGNASKKDKPPIDERRFADVDMDNVDEYMKAVEPAANLRVDNKLGDSSDEKMGVSLTFKSMDDFTPAGVARQVPALKALLEAREQLTGLMRHMDGKSAAEEQLRKLLSDPKLMAALEERQAQEPTAAPNADESGKTDET